MQAQTAISDADRLNALFANVEFMSPMQFRLGGGPPINVSAVSRNAAAVQPQNNEYEGPTSLLRSALASVIYFVAYARIYEGGPFDLEAYQQALTPDAAFSAGLTAQNPTATRWESGWKVFQLEQNGAAHVQKGDSAMLAQPGQYAFPGNYGRVPMVGEFVDILVSPESFTLQQGSYFAFGDTIASDYDFARLVRFYFNAPSQQAAWLLATIGAAFNRYFIPYRFKCAVDPAGFDRTDSVVVYLGRRFLSTALRLLVPLTDEFEARLRPGTPLFTAQLLNGVGAADDPGTGESFGQSRSRMLADGIVDAWEAGSSDLAGRRIAVEARFARAGISLQQPHLAQGLVDLYTWPAMEAVA